MSLLDPEAIEAAKARAIELVRDEILARIDPESLQTLDLTDCARYLGVSLPTAKTLLPVMELGPRIHRVDLLDFQELKRLRKSPPDPKALEKYLARAQPKPAA